MAFGGVWRSSGSRYAGHSARAVCSPSRFGDDHLGAELMELAPELFRLQRALDVVQRAVHRLERWLQLLGRAHGRRRALATRAAAGVGGDRF